MPNPQEQESGEQGNSCPVQRRAVRNHTIKQFVGHWVVGVQLIQLLIMGDFIYQYVRCLQKGIPVSGA